MVQLQVKQIQVYGTAMHFTCAGKRSF